MLPSALNHRYFTRSLGDFSGNENHGVMNTSGTRYIQHSRLWTLEFDGTNGEVDCGSDSSLDMTGDYTLCVLVASDNITANSFIAGRYNDSSTRGFGLRFDAAGTIRYLHTVQGASEGGLLYNSVTSLSALDDGLFHWIVAKFVVGVGSSLYVDGTFQGSDSTRTAAITSFIQNFYVGRQHGGAPRRMQGRVAEVLLWPSAVDELTVIAEQNKYRSIMARAGRPAISYHLPVSGQSLSTGREGQPALSTAPHFGATFENGPRSDTDELDYLIPLVENDNAGPDGDVNCGETICHSLAQRCRDYGRFDVVTSAAGHVGFSITQLNKGTPWYDYVIAHMTSAAYLKQAVGNTLVVGPISWIQGESDRTMNKDTYKGHLLQYRTDVDADAKTITGQLDDVPLVMYQMAYYSRLTPNVTIAQYELDRDEDLFCIASPIYHLPYDDGAHLTNIGYKWLGHYFGKALGTRLAGSTWYPLRPTSVVLNGKIFTVTFEVPDPPLVLDDVNVGLASGYGFSPRDDVRYLTVNRVEVVAPTQVEVEVDEVVGANPRVRYARDWLGSGMVITGGASGNLRDSCPDYFNYGGSANNLYNWCVHFEEYV